MTNRTEKVGVIGGCGHVGLPLALMFADAGTQVLVHDINAAAVAMVREGRMPFREEGADANPAERAVLDAVLLVRQRLACVDDLRFQRFGG